MDNVNQFFIDNQVVKSIDGQASYDKFAVASTLFDMSFQGAMCHLIEGQILNDCSCCNLRPICSEIDKLVQKYIDDTTIIQQSFSFE